MAKQKNTANKKLHSKLMAQKKNKEKSAKELHKMRLRELAQLANKQKQEQEESFLNLKENVE
ncbi:MAG: hypothetical protein ACO1N0_00045 [Fluviicola sp.]